MTLAKKLLKWFDQHGRHDLPWQKNTTSYRVWVSEIMLQQTQVTTVIPYYLRFMKHFPTIKQLANADQDAVLSLWTGLGYYARARHLHKTAKIISNEMNGRFPKTIAALEKLPGIGRSTAGAILSLSQNRRVPILDGNVKRVFSRLLALKQWPGDKTAQTILWKFAEDSLPQKRVNHYNQALMDLGATLCTRTKPQCERCPFIKNCQAYAEKAVTNYPYKKIKKTNPTRSTMMLLLENEKGEILLHKRPPVGIWGGLWSLPECDDEESLIHLCKKEFACTIKEIEKLSLRSHVFSHFTLAIQPIKIKVKRLQQQCMETTPQIWYNPNTPLPGGMAAPVLKLLKETINGSIN